MGATCPIHGSYQAIIGITSADGSRPEKSDDILVRTLACGHSFGSDEFNEYMKEVRQSEVDMHRTIKTARDTHKKRASEIWAKVTAAHKAGGAK